jgi:two-component system chemotaxis response regulator CheB
MVRVLVADDSAITREMFALALESDPGLQVIASVRDGAEAVERTARLRPDVVLMDIHMPRMDGYTATRHIMEETPTPVVLVTSTYSSADVAMSLQALDAGALTVVEKPAGFDHPAHVESVRRLVNTVRLMAEVKVVHRWPRAPRPGGAGPVEASPGVPPLQGAMAARVRILALGASTGGPGALAQLLGQVGESLNVPILVAQHIAPGFVQGLATWLASTTRLDVRLAVEGEAVRPGTVYLASDEAHLGVTPAGTIHLSKEREEIGFFPSATHLFRTVARAYGRQAIGVLLTGMGKDGAAGLLEMRAAGAVTIAQDQETSVVYGMPGEAVRIGAATYVLAPDRIAQLLVALTAQQAPPAALASR